MSPENKDIEAREIPQESHLADTGLSFSQIKELMTHMKKEGVTSFQFGEGRTSLSIAREKEVLYFQSGADAAGAGPAAGYRDMAQNPSLAEQEEEEPSKGFTVTSPVVGVFYDSPAPEEPPYVTLGSCVKKGDVLCIIEAMKLMNEVTSPVSGIIREILVQKASRVEYGHKLYVIDPSQTEEETNE